MPACQAGHGTRVLRRALLRAGTAAFLAAPARIPDKHVILTFDDAVKSHRTFVAPFLRDLGLSATFFVTHAWMPDSEHFMSWQEIAEIHRLGFEIGNHTWTHANFSVPRHASRLAGELALVENELKKAGVPAPVSLAYPGNSFGPEALAVAAAREYRFARRGMMPEVPYGKMEVGPAYDPARHDPLLIPTTGDAYPNWTFEHFRAVVSTAHKGRIAVLQFHGVPDIKHPWVHTSPELFRQCMKYLKDEGFTTLAVRDLARFVDLISPPDDPLLNTRYPQPKERRLLLPIEMEASRRENRYWAENMLQHRYTPAEFAAVLGSSEAGWHRPAARPSAKKARILPYPGGRHTRIGFLEGAIDPLRGTKASVFLPWDDAGYVVVDVPEAIFSNLGLTFLAHTHIPTIWNERNVVIENVDWQARPDGGLESRWKLPNGIGFAASLAPWERGVTMQLSLENGTKEPLTKLRTQICVLLKGAPEFASQTNENKLFTKTTAAVRSQKGRRFILTSWERCGRTWGNAPCPCMHSDPVLPDCAPQETVSVRGRLWFYEGSGIDAELAKEGVAC